MAAQAQTGFVLDTNTWRGGAGWAPKLGLEADDLLRLSRDAIAFAKGTRDRWQEKVSPILVNGVIGPAGDGYAPETALDPDTAERFHTPQIEVFAQEGVDMISALTIFPPHSFLSADLAIFPYG